MPHCFSFRILLVHMGYNCPSFYAPFNMSLLSYPKKKKIVSFLKFTQEFSEVQVISFLCLSQGPTDLRKNLDRLIIWGM